MRLLALAVVLSGCATTEPALSDAGDYLSGVGEAFTGGEDAEPVNAGALIAFGLIAACALMVFSGGGPC